jgi:hypothetical protein
MAGSGPGADRQVLVKNRSKLTFNRAPGSISLDGNWLLRMPGTIASKT